MCTGLFEGPSSIPPFLDPVYKEIKNDAVKTNIRLLNEDERITSIARMLSGEKPTAAALENAREMMN